MRSVFAIILISLMVQAVHAENPGRPLQISAERLRAVQAAIELLRQEEVLLSDSPQCLNLNFDIIDQLNHAGILNNGKPTVHQICPD